MSTKLEIAKLKERVRKHVIKKENFKRVKASWEDGKVTRYEVMSGHDQYFTWIVPVIKKERYVKKINGKLRTKIQMLKDRLRT